MRHFPDRPDRVLQRQVAKNDVALDHLQQRHHRPHLDVGGVLGHVRVAGDHMEPPVTLGVGVRLVAGVDDRP